MNRLLASLAVALLFVPALALAEDKVVEATGVAAVNDGNKALARDRAVQDALRRAVEQACGAMVVSASEARNAELVNDKILTQAKGYVSKYDVLSGGEKDGTYEVRVKATVGQDKLAQDLAAIGLTLARKGMPRVAVLIAEQRIDEAKPAAWWGAHEGEKASAGALSLDQRLVEHHLLGEWSKAGFVVANMDALAGKVRGQGIVSTSLSKEQVRAVAELADVDVVIVGSAVATKTGDQAKLLEGVSAGADKLTGVTCSATVTAQAYNGDTGDNLATAEETAAAMNQAPLPCGRDALVKAAAAFAPKLQQNLLDAWSRQLGGTGRVRLLVRKVDSLKTLNALKSALASGVRGVEQVNQKGFKDGNGDLDLRVSSTAEEVASELEDKVFGKKKVRVTSVSANVIEVELK